MVDGNDLPGTLGEELGESTFARPEIRNDLEVEDLEQALGECLPRTARDVMTAELPGQLVEVGPGAVLALVQEVGEGRFVLRAGGDFVGGLSGDRQEFSGSSTGIDVVLAGPEVVGKSPFLELGELGRDPGLAHPENFLQFRHAEGFLGQ